jgi:hypothetical protein
MVLVCFAFCLVFGDVVRKSIPETQPPPNPMIGLSAVYDKTSNRIYLTGGHDITSDLKTSDVYYFDLTSRLWERELIGSELIPSFLLYHKTFLNKNREILVFSLNHEIYKFNLKTLGWSSDYLKGDVFESTSNPSITWMTHNSTEFIVIFGGLAKKLLNTLYL